MVRINWTAVLLIGSIAFFAGALYLAAGNSTANTAPSQSNVSVINNQQVVEIFAKGGYTPRVTLAKAGLATTLKVSTRGTFDCSSSLVIPALNYRANLRPTGVTEVPIPPQAPGTVLRGLCGMGMYSFQIKFS